MTELRRLRDHPLVAELEQQAVIVHQLAADAVDESEELADISRAIFGIAYEDVGLVDPYEWEETIFGNMVMKPLPADEEARWEAAQEAFAENYALADAPDWDQVRGFAALGWDVTDQFGKPLRVVRRFSFQLLAAIRGEYGATLPGVVPASAENWAKGMRGAAETFLADKRRSESRSSGHIVGTFGAKRPERGKHE